VFPLRDLDAGELSGAGRRERKKLATRTALNEAAARLFATQGYEQTSVDDLCREAQVSLRTFFRYFDTKEDVLFARDMDIAPFLGALRDRPAEEPPLIAFAQAYLEQPRLSADDVACALQFHRAMGDSTVLQGRYVMGIEHLRAEVAHMFAARAGRRQPNDVDLLAAVVGQSTLDHAYRRWLARDGRGDLRTIVRQAFRDAAALVEPAEVVTTGPTGPTGAPRAP
jgi:AcrR family transcriptional regulator